MLRGLFVLAAGSAVAFGLLFLMQALIASGQSAMTAAPTGRVVDFVRVEREETVERRQSKPERPSRPEALPPDAPQPSLEQAGELGARSFAVVDDAPVEVGRLDFQVGAGFGIAAGSADGDYVPLVRVAPMYPPQAQARNVEGWVILELTVTETGAVRDPRVVESEPSDIFDRAAINAALKFKYKPRIVNGKPIEVQGVRYKMTFRLVD